MLSARTDGLVQEMMVEVGSRVQASGDIMRLDSMLAELALERLDAELRQARTLESEAKRLFELVDGLVESGGSPASEAESRKSDVEMQIASVRRAEVLRREQEEIIRRHRLPAPFAGIITAQLAEAGEWVNRGDPIVELVELDRVLLDVRVPQEWADAVNDATHIEARLDAHPGVVLRGSLTAHVEAIDPVSRAFLLRFELDDVQRLASPGMSARVSVRFEDERMRVRVPRDAVVRSADGAARVLVVERGGDGQSYARHRSVSLGASRGRWIAVVEGLAAGEMVVQDGNESLEDGDRVRVLRSGGETGS